MAPDCIGFIMVHRHSGAVLHSTQILKGWRTVSGVWDMAFYWLILWNAWLANPKIDGELTNMPCILGKLQYMLKLHDWWEFL